MGVKFSNNAAGTLNSGISGADTSLTLASGQGALFPSLGAGEFFFATLISGSGELEIIRVTGRSGDVLTIQRGQHGTTARAYNAGDKIELRVIAGAFGEFIQRDGSVVMTNTLNGTEFRSNRGGENARNTGFQFASGADIGEGDRSTQYYDDLATNCNGYMPNGNCAGNPYYTPPNGNWWTWGISGIPGGNCGNPSGFDFAGGSSNTLYPVYVAYNYDGYYEAANEIGGSEQRRWYRNCNCGNCIGNCYTNCNCNCACTCK